MSELPPEECQLQDEAVTKSQDESEDGSDCCYRYDDMLWNGNW